MLKLKDLILESKKEMQDTDQQSVEVAVLDFFMKNKKSFEKLIDDEEWDDFYEKAFEKFPEAGQDDVAQALNKAAMQAGFFESEETEMPTEKDLETMAFGQKSQQKGIKMGDYDKKMKSPKESDTDLVVGDLKKLKTESVKDPITKTQVLGLVKAKQIQKSLEDKGYVLGTDFTITQDFKNKKMFNISPIDKKKVEEAGQRLDPSCWDGYKIGNPKTKISPRTGKRVNNCVKEETEELEEAEYRGRKVKLGKPFYTPGGPRKRAVYVKNDKGNVVIVRFGEPGMKIKKSNPERRKSFRARHKCDTPGPKWKARWWSCKFW